VLSMIRSSRPLRVRNRWLNRCRVLSDMGAL
jgi:hypothetical protein